jgi:DNA-binding transcriptional regulator YhcF (GntR family)
MLAGKVIAEQYGRTGTLPSSRSVAAAASVQPATARRWLADMRAVMPLKASALTARTQP